MQSSKEHFKKSIYFLHLADICLIYEKQNLMNSSSAMQILFTFDSFLLYFFNLGQQQFVKHIQGSILCRQSINKRVDIMNLHYLYFLNFNKIYQTTFSLFQIDWTENSSTARLQFYSVCPRLSYIILLQTVLSFVILVKIFIIFSISILKISIIYKTDQIYYHFPNLLNCNIQIDLHIINLPPSIINLMLKVSLFYHTPQEIYQFLEKEVGPLYMLIKQSHAILQFQDRSKAQQILDSGIKPYVNGIPLKITQYQQGQLDRKVVPQKPSQKKQNSSSFGQDVQDDQSLSQNQKFVNSLKQKLSKTFQSKLKKLSQIYQTKISQFAQNCLDQQLKNHECSKYRSYIESRFKKYEPQIGLALAQILGEVKAYTSRSNQPEVVDLEPKFVPTNIMSMQIEEVMHDDQTAILSPQFKDGLQFLNAQGNSIKRICSLNQTNFMVTQKSTKNSNGQVKIYNCQKNQPELSISISEGPYSLLCYDTFILVGDYNGKINFINLSDDNCIEASPPLHYGLITQMQKFHNRGQHPSILALLAGKQAGGKDTKIKRFQIQKQQITEGMHSLTFHPKGQISCGGTTLSFQILDDENIIFGTEKRLIKFNQLSKSRETIVLDYNIFKIKKMSQSQVVVSTEADISIVDFRVNRQIDKFYTFKYGVRAIQIISENYLFFGAETGQVGVLDRRRTAQILWENKEVHTSKICDLSKVEKNVISGDNSGIIMKWQNIQI